MAQTDGEGTEETKADTAGARVAAKRAAKAARKAAQRGTTPVVTAGLTQSVGEASAWYDEHKTKLWAGAAIAGVIGLGMLIFTSHEDKVGREATGLLATAVATAQAPIIAAGETPPEGVDETYGTLRERSDKAIESYAELGRRFAGSKAAAWADLGRGSAQLDAGRADEAEKAFLAALAGPEQSPNFKARALEGLGYALEKQDKREEAEKRFGELAALADGTYKPLGDFHLARLALGKDKRDKAIGLLEGILEADSKREPDEAQRFATVVDDANQLLLELGVGTQRALKPAIPPMAGPGPGPGGPGGGGSGLTPELLEALKKQLAAQQAQPAQDGKPKLSQEIIDSLQEQLDKPEDTSSTPIQVKVPKEAQGE